MWEVSPLTILYRYASDVPMTNSYTEEHQNAPLLSFGGKEEISAQSPNVDRPVHS